MRKQSSNPADTDEQGAEILGMALSALHRVVDTLSGCIDRISAELKEGEGDRYDRHDAVHLAELGRHMTLIVSEARKAEAERRKSSVYSPSQFAEQVRRATPEQRAQMLREIQSHDRKRSVLS